MNRGALRSFILFLQLEASLFRSVIARLATSILPMRGLMMGAAEAWLLTLIIAASCAE